MKKNIVKHISWIVIGGMICFISACNNDSVTETQAESFLKYYAVSTDKNTGTEVIQTPGGYTILGNFESLPPGQKDIFVVFTDEFGRQTDDPIVIGTDLDDHGYSMIRLTDGGYIISGSSFNATQKLGYLVNISSDGRVLWEQNYSGYQELEFRDVYEANDGNLIMTGYAKNNQGDQEVIICKTSAQGELMWIRSRPWLNRNDVGEAIIEYDKMYHVLITSTDINNTRESMIRVLSTDTDGRAPTYLFIPKNYLSGKDLTYNLATGQIYILANNEDPASRVSSIYLAELELKEVSGGILMDTVKSEIISYSEESLHAESFALVEQNGLAIGGWQDKPNDNDILFLSVDNEFKVLKLKTYGSKGHQESQNIIYTDDVGGFALTGYVVLAGGKTSMLLKIDSDGELR